MQPYRITSPLLGLLIFACGESGTPLEPGGSTLDAPARSAAAIPLTEIQHFPTAFSEFLPCANDGAGEFIDWSGELTLVFHSTTLLTKEGELKTLLATFQVTGSLAGIGQSTGDSYLGRYGRHGPVHEREILDSARFDHNLVFDIQVRSAKGALVGIQTIRAHTTTDPEGNLVVDRFDFGFKCRRK